MMSKGKNISVHEVDLSRRRFSLGLAGTVAVGAWPASAVRAQSAPMPPLVLSGTDFNLRIGSVPVDFTGARRTAITVNGSLPGPVLRWREGTTVTLRVTNTLTEPTSIHWHGILLPFEMDGVPGISFNGIEPGETFVYRFPVKQSGTYWYHSHSAFQEQLGLYGALIIDPAQPDPISSDRDYIVFLSDWTDEVPERLIGKLKAMSDYYNYQLPTAGDFFRDVAEMGWSKAIARRKDWNRMRMNPTDVVDVTSATYTYLMNGLSPAHNWTALAQPGERVRLRVINGSASSIFDLRIPGLPLTVVSADGQNVRPVTVDELRLSTAETYDLIVQIPDDRAYTIFAQSIDRMAYARGTLAPRPGMQAAVPPLDPRTWLDMSDMGMEDMPGMAGMDGSSKQGKAHTGAAHAGTSDAHSMGGTGKAVPASSSTQSAAPNGHSMPGMADMPSQKSESAMPQGHNMSSSANKPGNAHPPAANSNAASMGSHATGQTQDAAKNDMGATNMDTGPAIDNRAMSPGPSVIDPGPRLRNNGRRVLTYADLHTLGGSIDPRPPGREIVLHLTGNMRRFIWGFDGKKFSEAEPIQLRYGERVRITLINDTMMSHPIHLHGMWSEVEGPDGGFLVRKHTVNVNPGRRLSYLVTADAPGQWAYHCHLLYHMEAGMFRKVVVG